MKPRIRFVENEAHKNELFAEIEIEKGKNYNIIITLLIDNKTHQLKETNILKEYFHEDIYTDTENINNTYKGSFQLHKLLKLIVISEKNEDLTRNYYHY